MDTSPNRTDNLARALPREVYYEIMFTLRRSLPPPAAGGADARARRDRAALRAVAALRPADAAEGRLAAQFVAADAWAHDCLRLAGEKWREPGIAAKCRAQSLGMLREAKSSMRMLLRLQAARAKREIDTAAESAACWIEHGVIRMMEPALAEPDETVDADVATQPAPVSEKDRPSQPTRAETEMRLPASAAPPGPVALPVWDPRQRRAFGILPLFGSARGAYLDPARSK